MPSLQDEVQLRKVDLSLPTDLAQIGLATDKGGRVVEVLLLEARREPSKQQIKELWKKRRGGRAIPLLIAVFHNESVMVCGPAGDDPPVREGLDRRQAHLLFLRAVEQPDRHAAQRYLTESLNALEAKLPGVLNEGLLSFHELAKGAHQRHDWITACARAQHVLGKTGDTLLKDLGFRIDRLGSLARVLVTGDRRRAVAVLLDQSETPEAAAVRFQAQSPLSYAINVAVEHNLPWVMLVKGSKIRLSPTEPTVGVGRRGLINTFVEIDIDQLREADLGLVWLLLSSDALSPGGSLDQLLQTSKEFADDLAVRLRQRIYETVVPQLAAGVVKARRLTNPTVDELRLTYEMALTVLFRLLFIAYAEDRGLLPYRSNDAYDRRALKTRAKELVQTLHQPFEPGDRLWQETRILFDAVSRGDKALGVPTYNGGLFSGDPNVSKAGAALAAINIDSAHFGPALRALLTIEAADADGSYGPVDFRSLGVREFGTIYEGLLESELAVADRDLALKVEKKAEVYVPADQGKGKKALAVAVRKGEVYLHNRSGARKASGSYFTPAFAVDHLLDEALEPALKEHVARLEKMDEADAADAFFDFRVADISMGSGHFLVSAVDRIERALSGSLARRNLPGVRRELDTLRQAAEAELAKVGVAIPAIEDMVLLRRLVARRCIYGVDLNPLSVQLARLSIWIHTFVPGLPLSLLDHTLVHGNALVGIATIEQVKERFVEAGLPMFPVDADNLLGGTREPLKRLAKLADLTTRDIEAGRAAMEEARLRANEARALFDIIVAEKVDPARIRFQYAEWETLRKTIHGSTVLREARDVMKALDVFHFPDRFPEVFLRRRPGFDVIVGNPPWEKVRPETHEFWARHAPGLRGLRTADRDIAIQRLKAHRPDLCLLHEQERASAEGVRNAVRHMPGMSTGHPDLFRAFMVRFQQLCIGSQGQYAVVLPGEAFKVDGNKEVRKQLFQYASGIDVQFLTNKTEWVFDGVHPQKLISLCIVRFKENKASPHLILRPEIHDLPTWQKGLNKENVKADLNWLTSFSSSLVFPLLPSAASVDIINVFLKHERIGDRQSLNAERIYADFETNRDQDLYNSDAKIDVWPVCGGSSFDIWAPDTAEYYSLAERDVILPAALRRRNNAPRNSPYGRMPEEWRRNPYNHPALFPRVAFRHVTNRTNRRTLIAALIPGCRVVTETAPWVFWSGHNEQPTREAYLLGVLSSIPADWWARRYVEGHFEKEAFNCLRIPRFTRESKLCRRAVSIAGRLACPDERFKDWAAAVGVAWGPLAADEKRDLIEELDAVVARLYGLTEAQLVHIFETFHENWNFADQLKRTLKHFKRLAAKVPA